MERDIDNDDSHDVLSKVAHLWKGMIEDGDFHCVWKYLCALSPGMYVEALTISFFYYDSE